MKAFILKHSEALLISTLAVFAPIRGMVIVALLAVLVDFITGIIAAKKQGIVLESWKMGTSVSRALIYATVICMFFLIQTYLLNNGFQIVNIIAGIIGVKEAYSILENLNKISGNNLFTEALNKLQSINSKKKDE